MPNGTGQGDDVEKVLPAEFGRGQRLPYLFGRGGDVDGVDDGRLEFRDVHRRTQPSILSASKGISSGCPVSRMLLRLDRIAGHPFEIPLKNLLPSENPSWVSVSFTIFP